MYEMNQSIPSFLQPFLWSYDLSKLDREKNKKRIITNVLNYGTKEATDWLFSAYRKEDIENAILEPLPGAWNKKSIHFWSVIFGVRHGDLTRHVA